jgi:uncharacterized membrane protein
MAPFSSTNVSAARVRRRLAVIALALGVLTLVGLIVLWPRGAAPNLRPTGVTVDYVDATVVSSEPSTCGLAQEAPQDCQKVTAHVTSGAHNGDTAVFEIPTSQFNAPTLHAGDKVVLIENPGADPQFRYSFSDFQRSTPLLALFVLFAIVVIAFGRWQGVRALAGLVASLAAILVFLLPSLLRGNPALPVAIVASFLIAYIALYLAHGVNPNTTVALLGTLAALIVTAGLAALFVNLSRMTGLSDEAAQILRVTAEGVDPRGLLIAGSVIGALGVLDDVTITQVSAVAELKDANPNLERRALYTAAVRIGQDHVASTVNTLVLAYVGASLPLALLFLQGGAPWGRIAAQEVVAVEIVRTLVGSIGLVLSVPFTTALAALAIAEPTSHVETLPEEMPPEAVPAALGVAPESDEPSWDDFAPEEKHW